MQSDPATSNEFLRSATVETFVPHVGTEFRVVGPDGQVVILALVEAQALGAGLRIPNGLRAPFSLVFSGPSEVNLAQRAYDIEHDVLGWFQIFLVPTAPAASGPLYEAVFG